MRDNPSKKVRLDKLLFDKGYAESREKAKALILSGNVLVNNLTVDKAGTIVKVDDIITIRNRLPYVSRGGLKLEHAIRHFNINVKDRIAMDVGASTGGFTDCLLQNGARKVYAVDVGYGQIDLQLRNDDRVVLLERTNIRYLENDLIQEAIDIATIDVSFISLLKVVPKVSEFLHSHGEIVALIKPQFEAGKKEVGKGGVVKNQSLRLKIVERIKSDCERMGFRFLGTVESPVKGPKGNIEYLLYLKK